jgi:hypothetical protein
LLCDFYLDLFGVKPDRGQAIIFNKLIRLYGRYRLFFAIISLYGFDSFDRGGFYPLLNTLILRSMKKESGIGHLHGSKDLTKFSKEREEKMQRARDKSDKIKIPEVFKNDG